MRKTLFCLCLALFTCAFTFVSCTYPEFPDNRTEPFRVALSLSPFSLNQFAQGYSFKVGDKTAATPTELQQIYKDLGSTEMYVRIATKRHITYKADGVTLDNTNIINGEIDENSNVHTLDQAIAQCTIAANLNIPINPELMLAPIYMDMERQETPIISEDGTTKLLKDFYYPELYAIPEFYNIMHGRNWEDLNLGEMCKVLKLYSKFVAGELLATGCTINNWNIGNEANSGFAGIGIGLKTAVNPELAGVSDLTKFTASVFSVWWLKEHLWKYEAQAMQAVKEGVLAAYAEKGKDSSNVKFSTHIATVVSTTRSAVSFFQTMKEYGYDMDVAGISFYPSAPAMSADKWDLLKRTVVRINHDCGLPVFIAEFSYPSGPMDGPFKSWSNKFDKYEQNEQGQADVYADVISWGKANGLAGIRYWAPDYEGWFAMSVFSFENKVGTAKKILLNHKEIVQK